MHTRVEIKRHNYTNAAIQKLGAPDNVLRPTTSPFSPEQSQCIKTLPKRESTHIILGGGNLLILAEIGPLPKRVARRTKDGENIGKEEESTEEREEISQQWTLCYLFLMKVNAFLNRIWLPNAIRVYH